MGKLVGSILGVVLLGVIGLAVLGVIMYFQYSNQEIGLRNQLQAQQKVNEAVFDQVWKVLSQQAGVADKHKDSFKEIYVDVMNARGTNKGGEFMKWVTESNPQFDGKLFEKLMVSIEAQRSIFTNEQKKLIDLSRAHNDLLQKAPSSFFLSSRLPVEIKIVTSSKTEETFATGKEDDVELFKD